jgi:hypothetical protein
MALETSQTTQNFVSNEDNRGKKRPKDIRKRRKIKVFNIFSYDLTSNSIK